MKLVKFSTSMGGARAGAMMPNGDIVDLAVGFVKRGRRPVAIQEILSGDGLAAAKEIAAAATADPKRAQADGLVIPAAEAKLLPPAADRPFIVCAGSNYRAHIEEMKDRPPPAPMAFIKAPSAVIATGQPIRLPPSQSSMVDFEGELCVVFGRECGNVSAADAMSYVAGYTILNDVSARDWVPKMRDPEISTLISVGVMLMGKQFPGFCPLGPVVVTADEVSDRKSFHITTKLNGKVMQDATTEDLYFDMPTLIATYSRYYTFSPGDVMSTGSPPGVGMGRKPPVFMKPGDEISVTVDGIGTLSNPVVAG